MSGTLLVRGARQLITLHGAAEPRRGPALKELSVIRDGALLIENGRILEVGLSRRVENLSLARRCEEIDATGRVVMPGFVDCLTHLVSETGIENGDEQAQGNTLPTCTAGALRNASAKRLEFRARQAVHGMARHGSTTLGAESGQGFDQRTELKILKVLAKLDHAPLDVCSTFQMAAPMNDCDANPSLLPAIRHRDLASFVAGSCDARGASLQQVCAHLAAARALGFELKVHAGEGATDAAVRLAVGMGAVSVDRLEDIKPAELALLAGSGTIAVLLPSVSFPIVNGHARHARQLIDAGALVALGTDFNPRTNASYSMQTTIALACSQWGMEPAEAICAATLNAAYAIGAGSNAGSLEAGKPGNLIILNVSDYREIPRSFGVNLVQRTVKAGVTIYQEGKVGSR